MEKTNESAPEEEIEITPEMIEAGAEAWALCEHGDRLDWTLSAIYSAMARAKSSADSRTHRIGTDRIPLVSDG